MHHRVDSQSEHGMHGCGFSSDTFNSNHVVGPWRLLFFPSTIQLMVYIPPNEYELEYNSMEVCMVEAADKLALRRHPGEGQCRLNSNPYVRMMHASAYVFFLVP